MNYRLIHKSVRSRVRYFPIIFLGLTFLFYIFYPRALGQAVADIAAPFLRLESGIIEGAKSFLPFFVTKEKLLSELNELRAKVDEYEEKNREYSLAIEELSALKDAIGRSERDLTRITGEILSRPPRSFYDTLLLDVGDKDGVREGMKVASGDIIIGLISKVTRDTSLVRLFSTAGIETEVEISHAGKSAPVIAFGEGGGSFKATLPKETAVSIGDPVIVPKSGSNLFANVESISGQDTDPFSLIRFKNPISIYSVRYLDVLK